MTRKKNSGMKKEFCSFLGSFRRENHEDNYYMVIRKEEMNDMDVLIHRIPFYNLSEFLMHKTIQK
jgi:hypothetical protein